MDVISQPVANPIPLAVVAVTTALYWRASGRVGGWPEWRTAGFLTGELALLFAFCSGIDAHDQDFTVHSIQQVLITMVAPIGFALSAPVTLALRTGSARTAALIQRAQRSGAARVITHPVFAWAFYATSVCVLYFTSLYAHTVGNSTIRGLVLFELFLAGCVLWAPATGTRLGYWWKMGYLLLTLPFHTIVGMALESATRPITPGTPLTNLHVGAVVVWVSAQAIGLAGAIFVFLQWLSAEEKKAEQHDRSNTSAADRQLAHWRETRDAAARAVGPTS
jgi:cytochrome c oxidase assembly factor CtaG